MIIQNKNLDFVHQKDDLFFKNLDLNHQFIIALDFDGVITSPYKLKTEYINNFGYCISEEQSGYDACIRKLGIDQDHYRQALLKAFTEVPEKLPLENNFLTEFNLIRKMNNILLFVLTSRYNHMLKHLESYLKHHQIKFDGIINTQNQSKTATLKKIQAHVFVEDSPFKLGQIIEEDKEIFNNCSLVLFRNKANLVENSPHEKVIELSNWPELSRLILQKYRGWKK